VLHRVIMSLQNQEGEQGRIQPLLFFGCQVVGEIARSAEANGASLFCQCPCRVHAQLRPAA